ncbi:MAG: A/G-specific adenine glycosylase [bacterium]
MKKAVPVSAPRPKGFAGPLLKWYDRAKRDLPWRGIQNPYATFVSEMMLQQTQVKTVIPYYGLFLKAFPNWKSLAQAHPDKVLKLWAGLGYYRRARNLQAAAQMVMKDFGGVLPDTLDEILKLPGVGRYSAGAVLSIAYGKPLPLVDGNVIRVFSRVFHLKGNLKSGLGHQRVWELAEAKVSAQRPGDYNQALMELGATLCFSENPLCLLCPLVLICEAAKKGIQNELPEKFKVDKTVDVPMAALLVEKNGKVLIRKRSDQEKWLKGMWEFPSAEGKTFEEAVKKLEKELKAKAAPAFIKEVRHQITRHKIKLRFFSARPKSAQALGKAYQWVRPHELSKYAFSSAQNQLRDLVLKSARPKSDGISLNLKF